MRPWVILNHDPFYYHSAKVECEVRDVLSCCKIILRTKMRAETRTSLQIANHSGRDENNRQVSLLLSARTHACTHTQNIKLLFGICWKVKPIENLK
jgi:hypothetical protein